MAGKTLYSVECTYCGQCFNEADGVRPLEEHADPRLLPPGQRCSGSGLVGHPAQPMVIGTPSLRSARPEWQDHTVMA